MASFSTRERIDALQALGYTEREAGFLVLAALHSGYFLRRQYYAFARVDTGKSAFLLEKKLLDNKHASVTTYPFGTQLYHLRSHPFYKAIGEGENRHRRPRSPLAIKIKLMGLDFVLARPQHTFLATEFERMSFFINSYGLDEGVLPGKTYRARHGGPTDRRYFIEKYPLFVASDPSSRRHLASFSYVDEGVISTAGFGSFLKRYARLFVELGSFRLYYVAAASIHFSDVERAFGRFLERLRNPDGPRLQPEIADYFRLRWLLEQQRYDALSTPDLNRLGVLRQRFGQQSVERRYAAWLKRGGWRPGKQVSIEAIFETVLLPHNYDIFADKPDRHHDDRALRVGPSGSSSGETFFPTGFHQKGV